MIAWGYAGAFEEYFRGKSHMSKNSEVTSVPNSFRVYKSSGSALDAFVQDAVPRSVTTIYLLLKSFSFMPPCALLLSPNSVIRCCTAANWNSDCEWNTSSVLFFKLYPSKAPS